MSKALERISKALERWRETLAVGAPVLIGDKAATVTRIDRGDRIVYVTVAIDHGTRSQSGNRFEYVEVPIRKVRPPIRVLRGGKQ